MLVYRLRRWPNIVHTLVKYFFLLGANYQVTPKLENDQGLALKDEKLYVFHITSL